MEIFTSNETIMRELFKVVKSTPPPWPVPDLAVFCFYFFGYPRPQHSKSYMILAGTACTVHAFSRIVQSGLSSVESTQPGKITVR